MSAIAVYTKALVSLAGATFSILAFHGVGVPEGINEQSVGTVIAALTPFLVYLFPNKSE